MGVLGKRRGKNIVRRPRKLALALISTGANLHGNMKEDGRDLAWALIFFVLPFAARVTMFLLFLEEHTRFYPASPQHLNVRNSYALKPKLPTPLV
jgi:hypothetical protein